MFKRIGWQFGLVLSLCGVAPSWAQAPAKPDAGEKKGVAAYIGDQAITLAEVDEKALATDMKLAQSLYEARRMALDGIILEKALGAEAAGKNMTVEQLVKEKAAPNVKAVTDADVQEYYEKNKARLGGRTLEQAGPLIRRQIEANRQAEARYNLVQEITAKSGARVLLDVPRVEVAVAPNDPVKGPANAKVTVVEFSEFQ